MQVYNEMLKERLKAPASLAPCSALYASPLGILLMQSEDGIRMSRLAFCDAEVEEEGLQGCKSSLPLFAEARRWLDLYFSGKPPPFSPPLSLNGTEFQLAVWRQAMQIPYGKASTYGELACRLNAKKATAALARAVGAALSRNPIALIVPCHRIIGAGGALAGYRWGTWRKQALLALELRSQAQQ